MNRHHKKITEGGDVNDKFFSVSTKLEKVIADLEMVPQGVEK